MGNDANIQKDKGCGKLLSMSIIVMGAGEGEDELEDRITQDMNVNVIHRDARTCCRVLAGLPRALHGLQHLPGVLTLKLIGFEIQEWVEEGHRSSTQPLHFCKGYQTLYGSHFSGLKQSNEEKDMKVLCIRCSSVYSAALSYRSGACNLVQRLGSTA